VSLGTDRAMGWFAATVFVGLLAYVVYYMFATGF
jgi:hypothetical protein